MKNFSARLLTCLLFAALFAPSCKKAPFLDPASPLSMDFSFEGGTASISFSTNRTWSAKPSASWCSLPENSGKGGEMTLVFTVAPNTDSDPRSCTISVSSEAGSFNVSVHQAQYPTVKAMSDRIELAWNDNAFSISTQFNEDYNIRIEGDWLTHASTRSLSIGQESFLAEPNRTLKERIATVYLETEGASATFQVVQGPYSHAILEETQPGCYGFDCPDVVYTPPVHQLGVINYASSRTCRILGPNEGLMAEISDIPLDVKEEDTFQGSVSIIQDLALAFSYTGPIIVLKKSGNLYWLAVNDDAGMIVRI